MGDHCMYEEKTHKYVDLRMCVRMSVFIRMWKGNMVRRRNYTIKNAVRVYKNTASEGYCIFHFKVASS
jgi:hypothetical protein